MRLHVLTTLAFVSLAAAGCGGSSPSPVSPSAPGTSVPSPTASTAVISGTVQGGTSSLAGATGSHAITGLTVTVVGTSLSAAPDATGRFAIGGVPPGDIQLRFTSAGVDSTVPVSQVQPSQSITLVVVVTGTAAAIESETRTGSGQDELEGRVESLPPTTAAATFVAAGRTVKTDGSTRFEQGSATRTFAALAIGQRVHVKGQASGTTLVASIVQIQNTNTDIPVEINGVIDTVTGTASAFQFKIGSRVVKGDAATTFFGDGSATVTFAALREGVRVEVKGSQRDGYIYATRIHINGTDDTDDDDDTQDTSASIQGPLTAMSGTKPALVLTVGSTTVRTTSATEVKRRGDVQTLDTLAIGQTLHVVGTRESNGSITARKIEIDDDAPGGEFEIEGAMGGLSGTCPVISFGVNGFQVRTTASTTFEDGTCASLKSGTKVQVKGTRGSGGVVTATRVKKK